jgi:hypothetical protein
LLAETKAQHASEASEKHDRGRNQGVLMKAVFRFKNRSGEISRLN